MADKTPGPTSKERIERERKKKLSVLKLSAQDLTKGVDEVGSEEVDSLIARSTEIDIAKVDITLFSIFEFQGFDPFAIIRKLIFLKNHYGLSEDDLKVDIMYMIAANIYMGNLSGKALSRRSSEGREVNDELVERYQIQIGSTGTGLPSDIITYPRVAGSFPVISCKMATRLPSKDFIGKPFNSKAVPRFMRVNAFASFCPPELELKTRCFLLKACAAYSCDQSIVFLEGEEKKKKKKPDEIKIDPALVAADQWTYIWAASEGPVPPLLARKKLHTELNLISLYDVLLPVVNNYDVIVKDETGEPSKKEYEEDITKFISD